MLTHFVDIYHLFTSTEKNVPVSLFFLNVVISLSLNDSAERCTENNVYMVLLEACSSMVLMSLIVSGCLSSSRV